ncbi:hypothetical protein NBRC116602_00490 [Hyphomicrobiales bacterium 4NK60-0047b]
MTPTLVKFQREQDSEPVVQFTIPKAYIVSASPYTKKKISKDSTSIEVSVLPDKIIPSFQITLWVGAKTGKPLKVTEKYGRRTESGYFVRLRGNYSGVKSGVYHSSHNLRKCTTRKAVKIDEISAYDVYRTCAYSKYNKPSYGLYGYIRLISKTKARRSIACLANPGNKRKILCNHALTLRDGLEMEVSIRSFRQNQNDLEGGLLKAEKQVAFVLDAICPMVGCDPKYKSYYDNLGEN